MKTTSVLLVLASIALKVLIYSLFSLPNPLDRQYNTLVQSVINEQEMSDEQELFDQYPELLGLQQEIQEIKQMHQNIQRIKQDPIPPEEKQSIALMDQIQELKRMEAKVQFQISQMARTKESIAQEN